MDQQHKNNYVKEQITAAMLELLQEKTIKEITISQITTRAQVARVSFYRNYTTKEDILSQHACRLLKEWKRQYETQGDKDIHQMLGSAQVHDVFGSLFAHFKENSTFYQTLYKQNLLILLLDVFQQMGGEQPADSNAEAYFRAFITYGMYGWVQKWFELGMSESAQTMSHLLTSFRPDLPDSTNQSPLFNAL